MKGARTVDLEGGPMDGWIVAPEAPALRPEWGREGGHGGRYGPPEQVGAILVSRWLPDEEEDQ